MDELNENEVLSNENLEENVPKKNGKFKVVLGVLGIGVIIAVIIIFILMFTSPKYRYFSLLGNGFSAFSEMVDDAGNSVFGRILKIDFENKLDMNTEVSASVDTNDAEILAWLNGFKDIKLIANEKSDFNNEYFSSAIKVILNGEEFILADLLRKNNVFSVNVNEITDGYVSVDNDKLSELWDKIGYEGPDKFNSQLEMLKEINISESDIKDLKNAMVRVGKAFTNAFNDDDFSFGEEKVNYNEKSIDAKFIDFKMNSYEMNNGIVFALEQLLKEDRAIDALLKISNAYDNMNAQLGYEVVPFTREEFVEALNYILAEVKMLEFSEEDGMIIRLFYEGNDIIKVEVFNMNYTASVLKLVMIDDGIEKYYEYTNEVQSFVDNVYAAEKGVLTHTIDINYINYETGEFLEEYGETVILTVDTSSKDENKIMLTSEDGTSVYSLVGKIEGSKKDVEFSMIMKDDISSNNINIKFNINEDAEFNEKVVENAFNASSASDEEINNKKDLIIKNWNDFLSRNEEKMKALRTAISIYLGSMESSSYDDYILE